jgi:hypothetical protein
MATMGKRKIKNGQTTGATRSTHVMLKRPLIIPHTNNSGLERLNVVITPVSRLNISTAVTVGNFTLGSAIMREGFVTETGLLP